MFEENLMELFSCCRKCSAKTSGEIHHTMVKIKQECEVCEYTYQWYSWGKTCWEPHDISWNFIFWSTSKVLGMYKFCKIATISIGTFINHHKYYLFPSISHVWSNFQQDYIDDVKPVERSTLGCREFR